MRRFDQPACRFARAPSLALAATALLVATSTTGTAADGPLAPLLAVRVAPLAQILTEVKTPGARAVLANVWATWCEPCLEELPDILRYYRENRGRGLRLVLISADDEDRVADVRKVLSKAAADAGFTGGLDVPVFIKHEDDMKFINGLDFHWSGAIPATFLFDGHGQRAHSWLGPVTYDELRTEVESRLTTLERKAKTDPKVGSGQRTSKSNQNGSKAEPPGRQP